MQGRRKWKREVFKMSFEVRITAKLPANLDQEVTQTMKMSRRLLSVDMIVLIAL